MPDILHPDRPRKVILPPRMARRPLLGSALAFLALSLPGCGGLPGPATDKTPTTAATTATTDPRQHPAYAVLQQAEKAPSPQRENLLLDAARLYQQSGDTVRASRTCNAIEPGRMDSTTLLRNARVCGEWALTSHQLAVASHALLDPALTSRLAEGSWSAADASQLHQWRADLYQAEQQRVAALAEWLARAPLLTDAAAIRSSNDEIWRLFSQLSDDEFSQLSNRSHSPVSDGWVALARIQRTDTANPERQAAALKAWQQQWPDHPASRALPEDMKLLSRLNEDRPHHLALLLPLSGKRAAAGQAVRDGFLAAYYQSVQSQQSLPAGSDANSVQIDLVDTESGGDLMTVYRAAVAAGAELVIGPLERDQVQALAREASLPVPTLALNNAADDSHAPAQLYQFSLNPEDEARQVADMAWANQYRRAMVIVPEGERGQRIAQTFNQHWQSLGGSVSVTARYRPDQPDYTGLLAASLAPGHTKVKSAEERRQDIDMIFLVGRPVDVSQLMPALAYNYAGHLPVYSVSQAYSNQSSAHGMDNNGLRLCVSPWQAGQGELRNRIFSVSPPAAGLDSLYALGADAQQVYLRLPFMQVNENLSVPGNTGDLHLDKSRHIVRRLQWVMMQGGQAQPVSAADLAAPVNTTAPAAAGNPP